MKIVYVITRSDRIGGSQIHVRDLAVAMQGRGHDVHVLCGGDGVYFDMLREVGVAATSVPSLVRPVRPALDRKCYNELKSLFAVHQPDLVHSHSSKAGILGRLAAYKSNIQNIFSAHGWSFTPGISKKSAWVYKRIERQAARWCDRILVGCEGDRQYALQHSVASPDKIKTIWYGMHHGDQDPIAVPEKQPPNLLMVARFEKQKDHATLISALAKIKDLSWTIDLLGDGPLRPEVEASAIRLGIADRIQFRGAVPSTQYLGAAQLFLLITQWEGLPLSTIEAMRTGLPMIGSRVGGIPEQITEGENGFLVDRGNVDELAVRLRTLVSDARMRKDFGDHGRKRFLKDFTYQRMLIDVEAVYRDVVSAGGRRR
jgi:glycosyltransferase involved in cell wall biosynthesis